MLSWLSLIPATLMLAAAPLPQDTASPPAPQSQPASRSSETQSTARDSEQVEILRKLLRQDVRDEPILPQPPSPRTLLGVPEDGRKSDDVAGLLLEGTILVERPGRLIVVGDKAEFVFRDEESSGEERRMEINKNRNLETMERLAAAGFTEFLVSGEVTQYHDRNYLTVRKVLRRVSHGNLGP